MVDKSKKKRVGRVSKVSKGQRRSSMKTSGFDGKFVSRAKVTVGWDREKRK